MGCGSTNAAAGIQAQQQQQQALTDQSVQSINSAFSKFNPSFYQGVQNAYTNWALPQVQQQYQTNQQQLGAKLANQGILNSSAANQAKNALSGAMTQAQNTVANSAVQQGNQLQQQVAQEQANLIGQAQSATNPSSLGTQAASVAASIQAPSTFSALGNMFQNFGTQYLGGQTGNSYSSILNYLSGLTNPTVYSGVNFGLPSNSY
ncbi:MAG: hypothetical protein KGL39_08650 [Patescibacteria group bacterium]|nr:hypothetical protein [Patescibacteria group bacterium]